MNISKLYNLGIEAATKNAPAILTAFGAAGVVTTAVLTARATFQAAETIRLIEVENNIEKEKESDFVLLTRNEKIKLVAPLYVSAVFSGVLSCGAVIMSHRISAKRAAVIAAAYAMNEEKLQELQTKVRAKLGDKKAGELRDEMAAEKVAKTYDEKQVIFSPTDGKSIIHDHYSGRYFWSSIDLVEKAVNVMNHEINVSHEMASTLSDFYDHLGLDRIAVSDKFGWNVNDRCVIEWSTTTTPDGQTPVHSFEFVDGPVMDPASHR